MGCIENSKGLAYQITCYVHTVYRNYGYWTEQVTQNDVWVIVLSLLIDSVSQLNEYHGSNEYVSKVGLKVY